MLESNLTDELSRLNTELDALRLANLALEQQMLNDAEQTDAMLKAMELQSNALREANLLQAKQTNFIQRVMDTTGALMVVLGADGRINQVNRRFVTELGINSNKPLQENVLDSWLHPDESQQLADKLVAPPWPVISPLFELVYAKGTYAAEHRLVGRDGGYRPYWLEASRQYNAQGKEEGAVVCATDISLLKQQQERLHRSESLLNEAQHIAQLGHWEQDLLRNELSCSIELYRILELNSATTAFTFTDLLSLIHPDDLETVKTNYASSLRNENNFTINHRLLFKDGRIKWVCHCIITHVDKHGKPYRSIGTLQDISSQRLVDEQLSLAASVFESSLNGILISDATGCILKINHMFCEIMGYTATELLQQKISLFKSGHHSETFYQTMWNTLKNEGKWQGEVWDRRKNGELVPLWQNISAVLDNDGHVIHYICVCYDLSEQKRIAEHIHHLAYYDALTDLPNRQLFLEQCEYALEQARLNKSCLSVLFLDLDRFKHVNDSLGHAVGDELLRIVATRLKEVLRQGDIVARLGGDEFIILVKYAQDHHIVESIARKILVVLTNPCYVLGHKLDISTSIGISCYPGDGNDTSTLIKHADLAMYKAKERGRSNFQLYETQLTIRARERLFLESQLRESLIRNELMVFYQPQFDLRTGHLLGAEALLRWHHSQQGMIAPERFIQIAEECGLIISIGEWVLHTACLQAKRWLDAGYAFQRMAVNLSGVQMERGNILATVKRVLAETGLPAKHLELEITETYIMKQAQHNVRVLESLRALGVTISIDDFGTGQSSLGYLKRLPVDKLKIDRSFIMDILNDGHDMAITHAILALGHSLHLTVLAEGIESAEQANVLKELNCDEAQGFYYLRPVDALSFEKLFNLRASVN